jgi:hypothetical protein
VDKDQASLFIIVYPFILPNGMSLRRAHNFQIHLFFLKRSLNIFLLQVRFVNNDETLSIQLANDSFCYSHMIG